MSEFHQIPIDVDSIEKTAFVTPEENTNWLGQCPSRFQQAIYKVLDKLRQYGASLPK